jgi:hypothetical protein
MKLGQLNHIGIATPSIADSIATPAFAALTLALLTSAVCAQADSSSAAFKSVYGKPGAATVIIEGVTITYGQPRLVPLPDGRFALVSAGEIKNAAHVESGRIAVHYLKYNGKTYNIVRKWWDAAGGQTGFGAAPAFSISTRFLGNPVVYVEGGYSGQGYTCSSGTLVELATAGPAIIATFPIYYSNAGTLDNERNATIIEGKVANIVAGKSFDVVYRGARRFTETYVRSAGRFRLAKGGESKMETC